MRKWLINFRIWKQTIYFPTNSCTRFTAWWGRGACLVSLFVAALWKHSFYPAGDCCCRDSSSAGSLAQFPWRRAEIRCTAFTGTCRIYYLFRGRSGHGAPQHKRCGAPGAGSAEGCGVGQETERLSYEERLQSWVPPALTRGHWEGTSSTSVSISRWDDNRMDQALLGTKQ